MGLALNNLESEDEGEGGGGMLGDGGGGKSGSKEGPEDDVVVPSWPRFREDPPCLISFLTLMSTCPLEQVVMPWRPRAVTVQRRRSLSEPGP